MSPVKPGELADRFADPRLTPVTIGGLLGLVAPAAIKMLGVTVSFDVSALVRVIVAPPVGAGFNRVTLTGTEEPTDTATPVCIEI